jgi:uncharacterized protein (DUF885 family)
MNPKGNEPLRETEMESRNNLAKAARALMMALALGSCADDSVSVDWAGEVITLADELLAEQLERTPEIAYFADLEINRHDGLSDNSLAALASWDAWENDFMVRLNNVHITPIEGTPYEILLVQMREITEASIGQRVCREELWEVNHMGGFQSFFPRLAAMQPVSSELNRADALVRWDRVATYIMTEITNLETGIRMNYLAPKRATRRVIAQVDGLLAIPLDDSPLMDPARRSDDARFAMTFRTIIRDQVLPAFKAYRDFLEEVYLTAARDSLAVSENPDGVACYEASYRSYTTLNRSAREIFDLGMETVMSYRAQVVEMGMERYGTGDFSEIIRLTSEDPDNQFKDAREMVRMFEDIVSAAGARMGEIFSIVPDTPAEVRPYPEFLQGTGMSARYERPHGDEPGIFRFDPTGWRDATIGSAQITAVHEAYPGHHMQFAFMDNLVQLHKIQSTMFNSAFGEGWARYAESLAEELGIYTNDAALIERRAWPARGMVVDAGLHVLGWSNAQALAFLMESGRFNEESGNRMLDRISVLPAQLTSYDSGALEIFALRREAEEALGDAFDIREFHTRLLENGVIPLTLLRQKIEAWYSGADGQDQSYQEESRD